jgi:hypothetical protein
MQIARCYSTPDGETHFEDIELEMPMEAEGSGNVPPLGASRQFPAKHISFLHLDPKAHPEQERVRWHLTPEPRFIVWCEGESEQETSDGSMRRTRPGTIILYEDTTGKGHRSRHIGEQVLAVIHLQETPRRRGTAI